MVPLRAELRRVVRMQADRGVHVGMPVGERQSPPATSRGRCRRRPSTRPPRRAPAPRARRRPRAAGGSGSRPTRASAHVSLRGNSGSPLSSVAPAGSRPHAAASGSRSSSGRPVSPSRRHSSAAAFGITGDASSATIAQRLETVAQHRGDRVGVALLVQLPGLGVLDVRVRGADEVPDRAEAAREVEPGQRVGQRPRTRRGRPRATARRRARAGTTPPQ